MSRRLAAHFAASFIGLLGVGMLLAMALPGGAAAAAQPCRLPGPGGPVSHVVYIQFDNVHFRGDNANVPPDVEQMPHLLSFLENGTLLANHHTPLLSHTADDLVTSLTGLYGDRHGMPIANEFQAYNTDGSTITAGSFAYWTDPIVDYDSTPSTDSLPTMVAPGGGVPPAPWVPYTRAGCNFGSVAMANTELENTSPDVANVFGANSPEAAEANANPDLAATDFEGLSIHCAQGAAVCSASNGGVPDSLPSEPGGYQGFSALFGSKFIAPVISPTGPVTNLDGSVITDSSGHPGFPGYNSLQPANSLAYTADLQEHGVPVTFTYVSSTHEAADGTQFGPGQSDYVAQLHQYDQEFAKFFARLSKNGINPGNTLFFVGSDENDQFVGANPSPSNCDGISISCSYSQLGEVDVNVQGLLAQKGITTPFDLHEDSAPAFYLHGQPTPTDPSVRAFERATAGLGADNPYTGGTNQLSQYLADPTELRLLHMVTADPARTPTFQMFANPFDWVVENGADCGGSCSSIDNSNAWNHGDVQPQITHTWAAMVGPGVAHLGATGSVWSDHTDIQPTLMALLGLTDDYTPEGRVLSEIMSRADQPSATRRGDYRELAEVYKQIEAPVGLLDTYTLQASTRALRSSSPDDRTYNWIESKLADINDRRDALAGRMIALLDGAGFGHRKIDQRTAHELERRGEELIDDARDLARD